MRARGFTLVELLCVVIIVAALSAILFPVLNTSIAASYRSSSAQRLKQLHVALMLYQAEWDGSGRYDEAKNMGLPSEAQVYFFEAIPAVSKSPDTWLSPCGVHPSFVQQKTALFYLPANSDADDGRWREYANKHHENALLVLDPNCNPNTISNLDAGFRKIWLQTVTLSGAARSLQTQRGLNDFAQHFPD